MHTVTGVNMDATQTARDLKNDPYYEESILLL